LVGERRAFLYCCLADQKLLRFAWLLQSLVFVLRRAGYTPLHMAVGYSHVGSVKVLLDAGASPDIPDNQGRNVVQLVDSIR